ncbi:MAG: exodeoxyribonuclease V subunit gamma [Clostridia bacterium]|nr:exodeoxyribonuclease V subunit gamma [Clostridia bacterium]
MLKLICGPSGSGKTERLISAIRADIASGTRCFLLVPEQQAYISERDLPARLPQNAGLYFEVVNFSRLCEDVLRAYGGITHTTVSGGMRALLMWNTLRTLSPLFKQYKMQNKGDTTLAMLMLQTVTELRANGIDSAALEAAAEQLPPDSPLHKKLSDIAMADAAYHASLGASFDGDSTDKLLFMAEKLRKNDFFAGCNVYVDSFTDFTVPEYAVLREILKQAKSVTVTLCADAFHSTLPQFENITETAKRLSKLAFAESVEIERLELPAARGQKPLALQVLERDLWNFARTAETRTPLSDEEKVPVRLFSCSNVYDEAEAAAIRICELVQSGMRYGDIAVVVRDTETYRGILDAALERHGIPYFLSERTDLASKPVSRLILSALRAVSRNYRQNDVMALLKTGLCGVAHEDAAMFEEYCETWHIAGRRFTDEVWSMNPDGLTTTRSARAERILGAANRTRKTLIEPLERLRADMRQAHTVTDRCRAVYDYLRSIRLSETLSDLAMHELSLGQARQAGESIRLYQLILDSLTSLCRLLPNEEMQAEEFLSVLMLLFSGSDLGSIPSDADCVTIGSASTLRVENVRASLLLGLCEGEFPRAVSDDGILSEGDKRIMNEQLSLSLDSREAARSASELFFVYRAMTKPTEQLSLFTVEQETNGTTMRTPSLAFTRVAFLMDLKAQSFDVAAIRHALGRAEFPVSPELHTAPSTAPVKLRLSQTKIQTFVRCPYSYYAKYRLGLREQKDSSPSYADDGTFLHYIFEHYLAAALADDGTLTLPPAEDTDRIADEIIRTYLSEVCPIPLDAMDKRMLHLYARLRKLALLMLNNILTEIRTGGFIPYRFEQSIGGTDENSLPEVTLTLGNGSVVALNGKIDRVDLFRADGKVYIRVVDYKTGSHSFSVEDVRTGLDIQLVLYLYAYRAAEPLLEAASAHYMTVETEKGQKQIVRRGFYLEDDEVKGALDGDVAGSYTKRMTKLAADEICELEHQMLDAVRTVGERILSGEAQKTPSKDACRFCPVRNNCAVAVHEKI